MIIGLRIVVYELEIKLSWLSLFNYDKIGSLKWLQVSWPKDSFSSAGVDGKSAREELLKQWAAGHDAFFEIKGNLQEGTKFYNDLTQLLVTFQNKVKLQWS